MLTYYQPCQLSLPFYVQAVDLTSLQPVDQWILSCLGEMVSQCDQYFTSQDLQYVTQALYKFWWNDFCAVYLVRLCL